MQEKNLKLVDKIMTALQKVEDPELLVDVVNLGLQQLLEKNTLTVLSMNEIIYSEPNNND